MQLLAHVSRVSGEHRWYKVNTPSTVPLKTAFTWSSGELRTSLPEEFSHVTNSVDLCFKYYIGRDKQDFKS